MTKDMQDSFREPELPPGGSVPCDFWQRENEDRYREEADETRAESDSSLDLLELGGGSSEPLKQRVKDQER